MVGVRGMVIGDVLRGSVEPASRMFRMKPCTHRGCSRAA